MFDFDVGFAFALGVVVSCVVFDVDLSFDCVFVDFDIWFDLGFACYLDVYIYILVSISTFWCLF